MPEDSPTMIIPRGTEIEVDVHGQLSIRTPGNLVIQHSGHYATIESKKGSIRIEPNASVEAVNVRCAETCFIEGSLTAWKVAARSIHLEDTAKANIVLQEAERLEVGSDARLVGNFNSENELFYLFSRFADQLRSVPLFAEREAAEEIEAESVPEMLPAPETAPTAATTAAPLSGSGARAEPAPPPPSTAEPAEDGEAEGDELPDPLFFSLVILEREFGRPAYGPSSQRVIEELIKLLRERDLDTLGLTFRTLFGRIVEPNMDVQRVFELIRGYYTAASDST